MQLVDVAIEQARRDSVLSRAHVSEELYLDRAVVEEILVHDLLAGS